MFIVTIHSTTKNNFNINVIPNPRQRGGAFFSRRVGVRDLVLPYTLFQRGADTCIKRAPGRVAHHVNVGGFVRGAREMLIGHSVYSKPGLFRSKASARSLTPTRQLKKTPAR